MKSDCQLLKEYSDDGSEDAFSEIVRRHADMVYGVCLRVLGDAHLAEDASQATFLVLVRKAKGLRTGLLLSGWLFRTAQYTARNVRTVDKRKRLQEEAMPPNGSNESEQEKDGTRQVFIHVDTAIASLPRAQQEALVLRYLAGKSPRDIAHILDCPQRTIQTRLNRALNSLRVKLRREGVVASAGFLAGILESGMMQVAPETLLGSVQATCFNVTEGSLEACKIAEAVMKMMMWTKIKVCAVVTMCAAVVLSGAVVVGSDKPVVAAPPVGVSEKASKTPLKGPGKVTIDGQNRICVDGKPFFPIGAYSVRPWCHEHAKELGFNTIHSYKGEGQPTFKRTSTDEEWNEYIKGYVKGQKPKKTRTAPISGMRDYLDKAEKLGLKVWMGLPRHQISKNETDRLVERINALKTSPSLLLWYLYDEPGENMVSTLERMHKLVRDNDPDHLTWIVYKSIFQRKPHQMYTIPDIPGADHYPGRYLKGVSRDIYRLREYSGGKKPILNVVMMQGNDWNRLRNMTYQSIAAGACGIFFYTYWEYPDRYWCKPGSKGAKLAKRICGELNVLAPIILADQPKTSPLNLYKSDLFLGRTFVYKKNIYLLVVNTTYRDLKLVFSSKKGGSMPARIEVLFEDRVLEPSGKVYIDRIEPNGARVYKLPIESKGLEVGNALTLPPLLSDGMVLQQKHKAKIRGKARDGKVSVTFRGATASSVVKDGKWSIEVDPGEPGGPFTMLVESATEEEKIEIKDVHVGDVWLLAGTGRPPYRHCDISEYGGRDLKFFGSHWSSVSGKSAPNDPKRSSGKTPLTAVPLALHFADKMQAALKIPVGVIQNYLPGHTTHYWQGVLDSPPNSDTSGRRNNIDPFRHYGLKGVLYVTNNYDLLIKPEHAKGVPKIYTGLASSWRKAWGQKDLAFVIANSPLRPYKGLLLQNMPKIIAAQEAAIALPRTTAVLPWVTSKSKNGPTDEELKVFADKLVLQARKAAFGDTEK